MKAANNLDNWKVVETALDPSGTSTLTEQVREVVALASGRSLCELWRTDNLIAGRDGGETATGPFPAANGLRLWVLVVPPDSDHTHDNPLHATATTDFGFVLHGSVELELADGSCSTLRCGDAFVQSGTRHRWRNKGPESAAIGVVVVGTASTEGGLHDASLDQHA